MKVIKKPENIPPQELEFVVAFTQQEALILQTLIGNLSPIKLADILRWTLHGIQDKKGQYVNNSLYRGFCEINEAFGDV